MAPADPPVVVITRSLISTSPTSPGFPTYTILVAAHRLFAPQWKYLDDRPGVFLVGEVGPAAHDDSIKISNDLCPGRDEDGVGDEVCARLKYCTTCKRLQ